MQTTSLRFHIDENHLTQLINSGSDEFLDLVEIARLLNVVIITLHHCTESLAEAGEKYNDRLVAILSIYDNLCERAVWMSEELWQRYSGKPYFKFLDYMLHGTDEPVPEQFMKIKLWPFAITTNGIAGDVMIKQLDLRGNSIIDQFKDNRTSLCTYVRLARNAEQNRTDTETLLKQFTFGAVMFIQGLSAELNLQPESDDILDVEYIH